MIFRRFFPTAVCALMLTGAAFAAETVQPTEASRPVETVQPAEAARPADAARPVEETENSNLANMGRGLVNILTCFLEVPRCLVYWNCEKPIFGLIAGAVNGTGCTAMRLMTGVTDILTLGFDYGTVFNDDFRPFVWQSRWLPPRPETPAK